MRALFEICLRGGWSEMSSLMLDYCKAVDRQIWPHQHPLRQFDKDISAEVFVPYWSYRNESCTHLPMIWLIIFYSGFEEAWRKRGWFRSPTRDARERYWSFDTLWTWWKGILTFPTIFFCNIFICEYDINNILYGFFWQTKLVKQHLGYFPSVMLSATVSPITSTVLKVFPI